MVDAVGLPVPCRSRHAEVRAQVDDAHAVAHERHRGLRRRSVGKSQEHEIAVGDGVWIHRAQNAIAAAQLWVNRRQSLAHGAVGAEVHELEVAMAIDEPDQLASGISGGTEDGDAKGHEVLFVLRGRVETIRIREYSCESMANSLPFGTAVPSRGWMPRPWPPS